MLGLGCTGIHILLTSISGVAQTSPNYFLNSIDLRSEKVQIPFVNCLPACPTRSSSSIDLREENVLVPGVNCIEVPFETITPPEGNLLPPTPKSG